MSLYIGKLSPQIQKDDLEHVFKRFGRCIIKMKDGYGFVVYDSLPDAQEALRALHGRNICGERLRITWSNKQPNDVKKFSMDARYMESGRGRNHGKGRKGCNGKSVSDGRRGGLHLRHHDSYAGKLNVFDERTSYLQDDSKNSIREQHHDNDEDFRKNDDILKDNKQKEQFNEISKTHWVGSGMELERYDPSRSLDVKHDNEYSSTLSRCSRLRYNEKVGMKEINEADLSQSIAPKSMLTCYRCGGLGHKMRECPEGSTLQQKSISLHRSDDDTYRRDEDISKLDEYGSEAQEKQRSNRNLRSRGVQSTRKLSERAKSSGIIIESSPLTKGVPGSQKTECEGRKRKESNGDFRECDSKRGRSSTLSHRRSNNLASRLHSASQSLNSISFSKPHSRLGSVSNRAGSSSSNSRATSLSHHSEDKVIKSRSRVSTPSSSSLSLSLSLSRSPSLLNTLSPSERQFSSIRSMGKSTPLELKDTSVEQDQMESYKYPLAEQGKTAEAVKGIEGTDVLNLDASPDNENTLSLTIDGGYLEKSQPVLTDDAELDNVVSSFSTGEQISDLHLEKNGEDDVNTAAQSHDGPGTSTLLEESNLSDGKLSPEGLRGKLGEEKSYSLIEYMPVSAEAPELACSCRSTNISSEEMCMVLEHYGLDLPNEDERNLPVDVYFGSARLWPWQLIYYRRLKKGLVSVENYERRVAQNKEYGIVDKYIRSSSGWGELPEEK